MSDFYRVSSRERIEKGILILKRKLTDVDRM